MKQIKEAPSIGVGVTAYNAEKYLGECLDSLLAQTYPNVRIVVCEDCSQDNTQDILRTYAREHPKRIRAIFNTNNLGIQANVNQSIRELGQPNLISLVAGDDRWRKDKLELEVRALQASASARWAYSQVVAIDSEGVIREKMLRNSNKVVGHQNIIKNLLGHQLITLNWTAENSLLEESGKYYSEDLSYISDWDFNVRLAAISSAVFCEEPTVFYRRHSESITFKGDFKLYLADFKKAYAKHRPLLRKLPSSFQSEVLQQQRNMLQSTAQLWLKDSLRKKQMRKIFLSLVHKLYYKIAPLPKVETNA